MPSDPTTSAHARDRQLGQHYTPQALARRMVQASLDLLTPYAALRPVRVLDPACGDGAFLIEVFEQLCARRAETESGLFGPAAERPLAPAARLGLLRDSIYGVDVDRSAIELLRKELLRRIGSVGELTDEAIHILAQNIRVGDALTGSGPHRQAAPNRTPPRAPQTEPGAAGPPPIDWDSVFPATAEGFDLVIGNPPYVRERDARNLFDTLARSELGERWREARMDLWYYFAHRGLDLLRPGGILSFVVNSYWTASRGARRLIERFERETLFQEIELLGNQPIFAGVSGRHLVFQARKRNAASAQERTFPDVDGKQSTSRTLPDKPREMCRVVIHADVRRRRERPAGAVADAASPRVLHVLHDQLFDEGSIVLEPAGRWQEARFDDRRLGDAFDLRQGMAENPPTITRRLALRFFPAHEYIIGEGVFVLCPEEIEALGLTAFERGLLRPYDDTQSLGRYHLPVAAAQFVLYLTRHTAPTLDDCPNIFRHLSRFRPILEQRREVRLGRCAWWHLHWPREESIFIEPRIVALQMGAVPSFVYATRPTFVGFSVNVIRRSASDAPSLPALTGALNSQLASEGFDRQAKRRGVHLDINGGVLGRFPLPRPEMEVEREISRLVARRQEITDRQLTQAIETEIERLVERWYGVR